VSLLAEAVPTDGKRDPKSLATDGPTMLGHKQPGGSAGSGEMEESTTGLVLLKLVFDTPDGTFEETMFTGSEVSVGQSHWVPLPARAESCPCWWGPAPEINTSDCTNRSSSAKHGF